MWKLVRSSPSFRVCLAFRRVDPSFAGISRERPCACLVAPSGGGWFWSTPLLAMVKVMPASPLRVKFFSSPLWFYRENLWNEANRPFLIKLSIQLFVYIIVNLWFRFIQWESLQAGSRVLLQSPHHSLMTSLLSGITRCSWALPVPLL